MRTAIILVSCLSLVGACKKSMDTAEPAVTDGAASSSAEDFTDDPSKDANRATVSIGPKLAQLCQLSEPSFDFNSSALGASAESTLTALAECLTSGPAKDESINLVGHADPRGDEEYNLGLGQRRATRVAEFLGGKGVGEDRMETSSRGELDAKGTDEASWAQDRRVEITLAE